LAVRLARRLRADTDRLFEGWRRWTTLVRRLPPSITGSAPSAPSWRAACPPGSHTYRHRRGDRLDEAYRRDEAKGLSEADQPDKVDEVERADLLLEFDRLFRVIAENSVHMKGPWSGLSLESLLHAYRTFAEVTAIFKSPVWTGRRSVHRLTDPGEVVVRDSLYWAPILCAFHGRVTAVPARTTFCITASLSCAAKFAAHRPASSLGDRRHDGGI
jgi:hypothetical protein